MKVMNNIGNRRFERADFNVKGFVTCGDEDSPVNVINISLKGVLVESSKPLNAEMGKSYHLRISLPHSAISIETESRLIHSENERYGFRFDSIEAEGMIHLRRLLELNLSSEEEIERELEFLTDRS
jgi:hypothetical protein